MHKLLPFRQYDEKDVLNLFQLELGSTTLTSLVPGGTASGGMTTKEFWSGTAVGPATSNDITKADPGGQHGTSPVNAPYLGAIGSGDQGHASQYGSIYPVAPMSVESITNATRDTIMGVTLKPTLAYDENGEKLLYYNQKKDELQCSTPGETVPVVSRGVFTVTSDFLANPTTAAVGDSLVPGVGGVFTSVAATQSGTVNSGMILAVGDRSGNGSNDTFLITFNANRAL
tara:strand:+ start:159 stop:845 length:687 start_codon:yes stop_codon:yes gene_type:complete